MIWIFNALGSLGVHEVPDVAERMRVAIVSSGGGIRVSKARDLRRVAAAPSSSFKTGIVNA